MRALDDFERFHTDRMASRILDMGDLLALIPSCEPRRLFDEEEAQKAAQKMATGTFTVDDFLAQMQQMRKLGYEEAAGHDARHEPVPGADR